MLKWFLIGLLLLLVVGAAAFGLYLYLQPEMVTAKVMMLAERTPTSWRLDDDDPEPSDRQIENYRQTLAALCISPMVLSFAMQNPKLQETFLTEEEEPREWLQDHVVAEFEGKSALLAIRLEGPVEVKDELETIVNAVCEAFLAEIVTRDRLEKFEELDSARQTYSQYTDRLRTKLTELESMRAEFGKAASGKADIRIRELEIECMERFQTILGDKVQRLELDIQKRPQISLVVPIDNSED